MAGNVTFSMFFDRAAVLEKVERGTKSALAKCGAFVRTAARSSLGRRKGSSKPGSPPTSHTRLLKDFIFFGYDTSSDSVVVGPMLLNSARKQSIPAPELLEKGGTIMRNGKPAIYHKFPFMEPAMERELPKFADQFAGSISD